MRAGLQEKRVDQNPDDRTDRDGERNCIPRAPAECKEDRPSRPVVLGRFISVAGRHDPTH
jgi:hypothetical protein